MKLNATHVLLCLVFLALVLNAAIALRPAPAYAADADLSTLSRQLSGLASGMEQILAKLGQIEHTNSDLANTIRSTSSSSQSSQGTSGNLGALTQSLDNASRGLEATSRSLVPLNQGLEAIYRSVEPLGRDLDKLNRNLESANRSLETIAGADVVRLHAVRMGTDDDWAFPVVPCMPKE